MKRTTRSRRKTATPVDFDTLADEVATLKSDFAEAIAQIKSGAVDHASEKAEQLLAQLGDRANELYDNVAEHGAETVEAVRGQVTARPLTAILIAFGVGFIASRMVLR
jgi:ElaB/YqjD/DUF883 family membrane-anchored ribosome-binding protein